MFYELGWVVLGDKTPSSLQILRGRAKDVELALRARRGVCCRVVEEAIWYLHRNTWALQSLTAYEMIWHKETSGVHFIPGQPEELVNLGEASLSARDEIAAQPAC